MVRSAPLLGPLQGEQPTLPAPARRTRRVPAQPRALALASDRRSSLAVHLLAPGRLVASDAASTSPYAANALLPMSDPEKDATSLTVTPPNNDYTSPRKLTVGNVPVDGFWSISVYKAQGYFEKNPYDAYSVNNLTGRKGVDGSMTVQFGGC